MPVLAFESNPKLWKWRFLGVLMVASVSVMVAATIVAFRSWLLAVLLAPLLLGLYYLVALPERKRRYVIDTDRQVIELCGIRLTRGFWSFGKIQDVTIPLSSITKIRKGTSPRSSDYSLRIWTIEGFFEVPPYVTGIEKLEEVLYENVPPERAAMG
jgi:hypothetical protein